MAWWQLPQEFPPHLPHTHRGPRLPRQFTQASPQDQPINLLPRLCDNGGFPPVDLGVPWPLSCWHAAHASTPPTCLTEAHPLEAPGSGAALCQVSVMSHHFLRVKRLHWVSEWTPGSKPGARGTDQGWKGRYVGVHIQTSRSLSNTQARPEFRQWPLHGRSQAEGPVTYRGAGLGTWGLPVKAKDNAGIKC